MPKVVVIESGGEILQKLWIGHQMREKFINMVMENMHHKL